MTETNPNDYPRLSAEEIRAHVTNIRLGLAKVHPLDQKIILEEAQTLLAKKSRSWRSMETAPKNFESVILKFRNDIYPKIRPGRPDLHRFHGIVAVMKHTGEHTEWGFSAPVGCGGFPDEWFSGWHPLPADQEQVEE